MTRRLRLPLGVLVLVGLAVVAVPRAVTVAQLPDARVPKPLSSNPLVPAKKALPHPLDPLSKEEITRAVTVVRDSGKVAKLALVPMVALHEPPKTTVLAHKAGAPFSRQAFLVLLDRPAGKTFEAVVDLTAGKLLALAERKGVQPPVFAEEYTRAAALVREDAGWRRAMLRRGATKAELADEKAVEVHAWAAGHVPGHPGKRLARAITYLRGTSDNPYPRAVEGLVALVDLAGGAVLELLDEGDAPIPADAFDFFDPKRVGKLRDPLRPLETRQPQGANFELRGHEVRWQNWSLRHSFHPREGLVLHAVSYRDGETVRPILYRASLNEMLVPYGDPSKAWNWRNAFDIGEYGFGPAVTRLRPGREVPDHATVLPVVQANEFGAASAFEGGVAVYEQDGGTLWTHFDFLSGKTETRRARQLVLHSLYTLGNYDYGVRWLFGQDGGIDVQVELTGIVLAKAVTEKGCVACQQEPDRDGVVRPRGADRYGALVAPQVVATHHQHFFNFRLDFDVDGAKNSVHEMELVPDAAGAAQPGAERLRAGAAAAAHREGGPAGRRRQVAPDVEGGEPEPADGARPLPRLRVTPRRDGGAARRPGVERPQAGRIRVPSRVGDAAQGGRELRRRRLPEPERRRGRAAEVHRRRRAAAERGRGAVAHGRGVARRPRRGVAGDARHPRRLPPDPAQLLRPQPGPRRAVAVGLRPGGGFRSPALPDRRAALTQRRPAGAARRGAPIRKKLAKPCLVWRPALDSLGRDGPRATAAASDHRGELRCPLPSSGTSPRSWPRAYRPPTNRR